MGRAAGPATTRLQELAAREARAGATKHSVLLDRDMVARLVVAGAGATKHSLLLDRDMVARLVVAHLPGLQLF